jgi:hypothetical protein
VFDNQVLALIRPKLTNEEYSIVYSLWVAVQEARYNVDDIKRKKIKKIKK